MSIKTAGVGHFAIPAAPAAGTSVTSGAANVFTTTYVVLTASAPSALFITGIFCEAAAALGGTYDVVQLAIGALGAETIIGQYLISLSTGSTIASGYRPIWPPIPIANATRITCKTADSVGAKATLITLECLAQTNYVDDAVAVTTVTTVTNQLTAAAIATAHWQDTTAGDFTVAASIGKSVMNGVALGTGLTINGYTGNTVQTGDSFARIGAAGASLTGITGVTLAASQHVIVDSGTVTTLTNLPSITAGWLTAAGITAGALNGKGDWLLSSGYTAPPSAATIAAATWIIALPGAYGAGTAGKIIGTNLDATISSRTKPADTQAAVTTVTTVTGLTAANLDVAVSSRPSLGQMIGAFIGLH